MVELLAEKETACVGGGQFSNNTFVECALYSAACTLVFTPQLEGGFPIAGFACSVSAVTFTYICGKLQMIYEKYVAQD